MEKITFLGTVLPSSMKLTHNPEAKITWPIDPGGKIAHFTASIQNSEIRVECEFEGTINNEIASELYMRATDVATATVDIIGFSSKVGFIAILHSLITTTGEIREYQPFAENIVPDCTAYSIDGSDVSGFHRIYGIVLTDPQIFFAMNDLVTSIYYRHRIPINCGRAIEAIRHLIAPGLEPKKQWPKFNAALRLDKSFVEVVIKNSTQPRHGNRIAMSASLLNEILNKSWTVMNRFLEMKKRGLNQLPQPEFPTLT